MGIVSGLLFVWHVACIWIVWENEVKAHTYRTSGEHCGIVCKMERNPCLIWNQEKALKRYIASPNLSSEFNLADSNLWWSVGDQTGSGKSLLEDLQENELTLSLTALGNSLWRFVSCLGMLPVLSLCFEWELNVKLIQSVLIFLLLVVPVFSTEIFHCYLSISSVWYLFRLCSHDLFAECTSSTLLGLVTSSC